MIDPIDITDYEATDQRLEETLLFWVCAAGKNAISSAKGLQRFLHDEPPFEHIKKFHREMLPLRLKQAGIGCYNNKARSFWELAHADLNLRECSIEDLETIYGIGMKTSRCFIMHSRKGAKCAGLDTHILKYMKDEGLDVPKSTPSSKKKYKLLEEQFLELVPEGKTVSEWDLEVWNQYRRVTDVKMDN